MYRLFLLLLCLGYALNSNAQAEASNWYFGFNSGINFDPTTGQTTALNDGKLYTIEGCATISDDSGNLLFYTDGITVWNKNHQVMPNGFNLLGDPSSAQSAIIVPKPDSETIYYIFTVDDYNINQVHNGLNYSEVDISLNDGLGGVTRKNVKLLQECSEKITAVLKDCITNSIWVIAFAAENGTDLLFDTFHAFEVNDQGINPSSITSTFSHLISDPRGYLKLSPDGKKIASANASSGLYIYDFDTQTGKVSNNQFLFIQGSNNIPYGVEFSPSGELLYVHSSNDYFDLEEPANNNIEENHWAKLVQFDLTSTNIQSSQILIDDRNLYRGALQLGPNGKIYRALSATYSKGLEYLGVINNPNNKGLACNYKHQGINLSPNSSSQGLPPFIASFFNTKIDIIKNGKSTINLDVCNGESYMLSSENIPNATYIWTKNNEKLEENSFQLEVLDSGHYEVYIDPNNGECAFEGEAYVSYNENPMAYDYNLIQCDEDGASNGFTQFNLNEAISGLAGEISNRSAKFYLDANRSKPIDGNSFVNTKNPQVIYAEVIDNFTGCSGFSQLKLEVIKTVSQDFSLVECDSDGTEDGIFKFNLEDVSTNIRLDNPTVDLAIFFYETNEDATLEVNNLGNNYENTTPYNQTIYARIENNNQCFGISEINLTVNKLPNISPEEVLNYCINKFPTTIPVNASVIDDSPENYKYQWSTGETEYEIEINQIGTYTVSVTSSLGCSKTKTIELEPSNIATIENIEVIDASSNNTISVFVSGEGNYEYSLTDLNNSIIYPFQESNSFENVKPGIYTLIAKDIKNNCGEVSQNLSVIGFPKYFTPNNDGVNDTWQIYGVSEMFQPNTKIQIFNRFGKLIKEVVPLGEGWNGLINGEKLPNDDYWFSVQLQDGRTFKDHFTLKN